MKAQDLESRRYRLRGLAAGQRDPVARRKGTTSHEALGWIWVTLMGSTAIASAFIREALGVMA